MEEMRWFGRRGAGAGHSDLPQTETPVGAECTHCEEPVGVSDNGWILCDGSVFHAECILRMVIGSVAHQQRRCSCYGGTASDDEDGMSQRESARAAAQYFREHPVEAEKR